MTKNPYKTKYAFVVKESKVSRTYGGATEKADIYQLKNNKPIFVDSVSWNTRGYKGADSEVYTKLKQKGKVSNKEFKDNDGYYRKSNSKVEIFQL